jgi:UDP-2-acetamido-3-amino-2,3-dideoxy-glucuronate N-acetyltransferase
MKYGFVDATAFIHPSAIVEAGTTVGAHTKVWAFAHILPGASVGSDCNICDQVFIENDVIVGDRVTIKSGVQLWDGTRIEDDVFVGPNATFCNDLYPRSSQRPTEFLKVVVRRSASIGANATLLPGIEIGIGAMVGAGAVVTQSVPARATVAGNPARIVGYTDSRTVIVNDHADSQWPELDVRGVGLHCLKRVKDMRGNLAVAECVSDIPFEPRRIFAIFGVPNREVRGEHAHKTLHQFLICVSGNCSVIVDDGGRRADVLLNSPGIGLHVGPLVWTTQYNYSPDAVLVVLASDPYDADDYIRDYAEFLATANV